MEACSEGRIFLLYGKQGAQLRSIAGGAQLSRARYFCAHFISAQSPAPRIPEAVIVEQGMLHGSITIQTRFERYY